MKKLIYLALLLMASVLVWVLAFKKPGSHEAALALYKQHGLAPDREAAYRVRLKATQRVKGKEESVIANLDGTLSQVEQSPGVIVSRWTEITRLSSGASEASAAQMQEILNKPIMTTFSEGEHKHFFTKDFPKEWFRMQVNIMQRLFIPPLAGRGESFTNNEKEELGEYLVLYKVAQKTGYDEVGKTWKSYENPDIVLDKKKKIVTYFIARESRLIAADGDLVFVHNALEGTQFIISLTVDLVRVGPKAQTKLPAQADEFKVADDKKIKEIALATATLSTIGFDEALKRLVAIDEKTDSRDLHYIFDALKTELRSNPGRVGELRQTIMGITARDEGAKRQLAAAFGAMAQSDQPSIANVLADMANECKDLFCKDQAIVALNDHTAPTPLSGRKMLDIVKSKPDTDTASGAVLAAGSIAFKIGDQIPETQQALIDAYRKPDNGDMKRSILAAMGNHGAPQYLPVLKESLKSKESMVRSTSLYSLRQIKLPEVDEILTSGIESEKDGSTLVEGLKAMVYRDLSRSQYERIAKKIATIKNEDLANDATRFMIKAYDRNPVALEPCLIVLKEKSAVPTVKSVITREIKAMKEAQEEAAAAKP